MPCFPFSPVWYWTNGGWNVLDWHEKLQTTKPTFHHNVTTRTHIHGVRTYWSFRKWSIRRGWDKWVACLSSWLGYVFKLITIVLGFKACMEYGDCQQIIASWPRPSVHDLFEKEREIYFLCVFISIAFSWAIQLVHRRQRPELGVSVEQVHQASGGYRTGITFEPTQGRFPPLPS